MDKRWTATILLVLGLTATGAALAWAGPAAATPESETPAINSPVPDFLVPGAPQPPQPVSSASCSTTYQACLAACGSNISCRNKCYCQYLDCIGSEAPCPS